MILNVLLNDAYCDSRLDVMFYITKAVQVNLENKVRTHLHDKELRSSIGLV